MKDFRIEAVAQTEFEEAAGWYESQRDGPGLEFIAEVDRVLVRIAHAETFAAAPIAMVVDGVVRRELVDRFPYVIVFVETPALRRVIMIRRGNSNPSRWRSGWTSSAPRDAQRLVDPAQHEFAVSVLLVGDRARQGLDQSGSSDPDGQPADPDGEVRYAVAR